MSYSIESLFDRVNESIDREDLRLQALEGSLTVDQFDSDGVAAMNRALTYVICGGLLEWLMRDLPQALADDVIALGTIRNRLPMGLLAPIESAAFRKCTEQTARGLLARVTLLATIGQHANDTRIVDDFGASLLLADGSSIGPKQFEALWHVLGLSGDWQNSGTDRVLLEELKSKRNAIAHWESDPVDVGRSRSYSDLRRALSQLRDLIDHLYLHVCDWLDRL